MSRPWGTDKQRARQIPQRDVTVTFTLREAAELHTLAAHLMTVAPDHNWSRPFRNAVSALRHSLATAGARVDPDGNWTVR